MGFPYSRSGRRDRGSFAEGSVMVGKKKVVPSDPKPCNHCSGLEALPGIEINDPERVTIGWNRVVGSGVAFVKWGGYGARFELL